MIGRVIEVSRGIRFYPLIPMSVFWHEVWRYRVCMLKHPRQREGFKSLEEDNINDFYYVFLRSMRGNTADNQKKALGPF